MTIVLIAGSTGLVGGQTLAQALSDPRVRQVVAPSRRALPPHPKLKNPVVDFAQLPNDADWWAVDAMICALGTTRAVAGFADAFRKVDFDYPLSMAHLVRRHGARRMALTSSMGADPGSMFLYTRTKGQLEMAIERLGWKALTIVRSGLLGGDRQESRPLERAAALVLGKLRPVLPPHLRISPSENVARALLEGAVAGPPGTHIVGAGQLA